MFERDGQAVYFGATAIENIFLTELMPSAKGDFVKVYLCALFHSGQKEEGLTLADIAQELGQTQAQVEAALRYWERRGALSYIASDPPVYRLYSLTQRALTGQDAAMEVDDAYLTFAENVYALFGDDRKVRPAEIASAYEWVVDEGLSPEAVLTLLRHQKENAGNQFSFRKAGEIAFARYRVAVEGDVKADEIEALFRQETILLNKRTKRGESEVDIKPLIRALTVTPTEEGALLDAVLAAGQESLNPEYLIRAIELYLGAADLYTSFHRVEILDAQGGIFE